MELLFLRHGATKGNSEGRYVGSTDEDILEESQVSLLKTAEALKKECLPEAVYVSPMKRCLQTAEFVYPQVKIFVEDDFREMDFGDFEYKNYEELKTNADYQNFIDSGGNTPFPKGESREAFQKRCAAAYRNVIAHAVSNGFRKIAFVVHGGTIMAVLDIFSAPHSDYFNWNVKPGEGWRGEGCADEGMDICALRRICN